MKIIILILLTFAAVFWARATTNLVVVFADQPGIVRLSTNLNEFAVATLPPNGTQLKGTNQIELIAWAAKSSNLDFPPQVGEEAIVLCHWRDIEESNHWSAICVARATSDPVWRPHWSFPQVQPRKEWESKPSVEDIAAFIKSTNFGYNEYDPNTQVMRVVLFWNAQYLLQTLEGGMSDKEKAERLAIARAPYWYHKPED